MKYSEAVTIIDNEKTRTDITTRSHIWIWKCKDIEGHAGEKGNKKLASPLVVIYYKTLDPLGDKTNACQYFRYGSLWGREWAIVFFVLKKDKETFGHCVFVFFRRNKTQKHIGCLMQSLWGKPQNRLGSCTS